jgi:hypothetical protein
MPPFLGALQVVENITLVVSIFPPQSGDDVYPRADLFELFGVGRNRTRRQLRRNIGYLDGRVVQPFQ